VPTVPDWSSEQLATTQLADPGIRPVVLRRVEQEEKPPWEDMALCSAAAKSPWNQWERLLVQDEVLYRRFYSVDRTTAFLQLVVPFSHRKDFCKLAHEGLTGGHMRRGGTEAQARSRWYWPGWSDDVRQFVRTCGPCAQYHRGPPPMDSTNRWNVCRLSIDITGPFPPSSKGNVFMLTVMNHFTKWSEAIPLRKDTSPTMARALMTHVFNRLGMPLQVLSDRGPEFKGELFSELCRWMCIHKIRTSAH